MTYYAYFASHAPLSTTPIGQRAIRENVYESELDFAGLWFEENIDEETGKRFHYSKHVRLRYQTRCSSNFLPMRTMYKSHNPYFRKISALLYEYIMKALEDSPVVVYYLSLDSEEDREFQRIRTVHVSEIHSHEDLHIDDREMLRIVRDDPIVDFLEDESGFIYVNNPEYLQGELKKG